MDGREMILILFALNLLQSFTQGFSSPSKGNVNENPEPLALPLRLFGYSQSELAPHSTTQADRPRSCYHFYVSQNMSSLLSDATKMLRSVHDKREREWILTFIYRIKSLAEHLRSHPDSQNYEECMSVEDDEEKKTHISESMKIPQPELYFIDDMLPSQNQKRSIPESETAKTSSDPVTDVQSTAESSKDQGSQVSHPDSVGTKAPSTSSQPSLQNDLENHISVAESTSESVTPKKEIRFTSRDPESSDFISTVLVTTDLEGLLHQDFQNDAASSISEENDWLMGNRKEAKDAFVSSTAPDCIKQIKCLKEIEEYERRRTEKKKVDEQVEKERRLKYAEEERQHQQLLKERIRKALLEELAPELKKLRTVDGTEEDLMALWRQSEIEVAKEEERKRREIDFDYEEEGAAAGDLNSNDKSQTNYRTIAPSSDQVGNYKKPTDEMPYDHSDVLVQQLYDAGRPDAPRYRSARALDSQEEYLIISSNTPY